MGHPSPSLTQTENLSLLVECGRQFYARHWMEGTAGNLSVKTQTEPLEFAISPSGVNKGHLKLDDLLSIRDGKGQPHSKGFVPSAETQIHQAIYESIPEAGAVFHVHPIHATVMS